MAAFLSSDTTIKYESALTSKGALERRGGQGETCGGVFSPRTGRQIEGEKKTKIKLVVALYGSRRVNICNNQPKTRGRDGGGIGYEARPSGNAGGGSI